jgi:site-specific DNA-methyltransferase (adenine-specific)
MRTLGDGSFDAVVTDPPYFRVKSESWDNAWDSDSAFLSWMGELCDEWRRLLKPNGSLYVFASPQMASRVECVVRERFEVLNHLVWDKAKGFGAIHRRCSKEKLRSFFPSTDRIIFAEQYSADGYARGESEWVAKCDELRGFVFEPLRDYLASEWERAGLKTKDANAATGTHMAGHWFTRSQWALPTKEHYEALRKYANGCGDGEFLRREYEDLRREYEDLRREYEDLRRAFNLTAKDQYTDVWEFGTVKPYKGKHPCEKPQDLLAHIIKTSTKPGAKILDCFGGSGATAIAAERLGRCSVMIEKDEHWFRYQAGRLRSETDDLFAGEAAG